MRNYAKSCKLGIEEAGIVELKKKNELIIDFEYPKIAEHGIKVIDKGYTERVTYKIEVDEESEKSLREIRGILII